MVKGVIWGSVTEDRGEEVRVPSVEQEGNRMEVRANEATAETVRSA